MQPNGKSVIMWECICDCGNTVTVAGLSLRGGKTHSCGCYNLEVAKKTARERATTHGGSNDRLYNVWRNMIRRCYSENYRDFKYYGGRKIKVCDEWKNSYALFKEWACNNGYDCAAKRSEFTLDRTDVDGDYCPENCRWVNMNIQANNKRNVKQYEYNGETHTISEWSKLLNINYFTLFRRLKRGMDIEKALCQGNYSEVVDLRKIRYCGIDKYREYIE